MTKLPWATRLLGAAVLFAVVAGGGTYVGVRVGISLVARDAAASSAAVVGEAEHAGLVAGALVAGRDAGDANRMVTDAMRVVLGQWGDLVPYHRPTGDGVSCVAFNPQKSGESQPWALSPDGKCHMRDFIVNEFVRALSQDGTPGGPWKKIEGEPAREEPAGAGGGGAGSAPRPETAIGIPPELGRGRVVDPYAGRVAH